MFGRIFAAAAFVAAASAQLSITNPSPSSWWVAGSENTLAWTCDTSPYSSYTVVMMNSDTTILSAPLALIADIPNYDCSLTVNQQQSSLAVSNTWTVALANIQNQSDIYATAQFSIEAAGSPYPSTTASTGASGTATGTGATASSTSSSKSGAASNYIPVGMSMAVAMVLGLVVG